MADIDLLVVNAQDVIEQLRDNLAKIEIIHNDIKALKESNENIIDEYHSKFQDIAKLANEYTTLLGASTNAYLEGNNQIFVQNLNTLDQKNTIIQNRIDALGREVERIENVDFEVHFTAFQKILSDIFGAVNAINTTFGQTTITLNKVSTSLTKVDNKVDSTKSEIIKLLDKDSVLSKNLSDLSTGIIVVKVELRDLDKKFEAMKVLFVIFQILLIATLGYILFKI